MFTILYNIILNVQYYGLYMQVKNDFTRDDEKSITFNKMGVTIFIV